MKEKATLREKYKKLRNSLSQEEVDDLSMAIANNSLSLKIWEGTYYHIFLPIVEKKEVNTEFLLHILQGRDKSVVVSKADFASQTMKHYLLQEHTVFERSNYGIPEPVEGIEVPCKQLDVVFVPLLAYDNKGHRIGYGKGFYDRFLAQCQPECIKVGLSFYPPEKQIVTLETDIALDLVVTPTQTYFF